MMIMVVIIFGVCWLPFHLYFIVMSIYPEINYHQNIQVNKLSILNMLRVNRYQSKFEYRLCRQLERRLEPLGNICIFLPLSLFN